MRTRSASTGNARAVLAVRADCRGALALHTQVKSDLDIAELIEKGLPLRVVDVVLESGLLDPE